MIRPVSSIILSVALATAAHAQLGAPRTADADSQRPAVANKSINPNTGEAGFKKDLQDAKEQKRNAEITDFAKENKDALKNHGSDKPKDPLAKNFGQQKKDKENYESAQSYCATFVCFGSSNLPKSDSGGKQPLTPPNPFSASDKDKPTEEQKQQQAEEAKKKKEEAHKQCMKKCIAKKLKSGS